MKPAFLNEFEASDVVAENRVSPEGRLCSQVILEALHDLRHAQAGNGAHGGNPYESAVMFFFSTPSPLDWMCAGLWIDVDMVRDRARQLVTAREPVLDIPTSTREKRKGSVGLRGRRLQAGQ